jgi:hypothetical protein
MLLSDVPLCINYPKRETVTELHGIVSGVRIQILLHNFTVVLCLHAFLYNIT